MSVYNVPAHTDMERHYRSQTEYGKYGRLICTPVCCLTTIAFVKNEFSDEFIDQAMRAAHSMYEGRGGHQPMMLQELTYTFTAENISFYEAAGLTHTGVREQIEGLLLCPLSVLIKEIMQKRQSLIVTYSGHTVCYLLARHGTLLHFDPLPATLKDVTDTWRQTLPTSDAEYSALVISCGCA